ncbi:MAG TPA: hypothetical protein VJH03_17850 [Blastocatellia bacterium]|nr:hypothetical protein [Blastocatellia bacterium]
MKEDLEKRLDELKREFEVGQNRLRELDAEQAHVRETLLRISGAIQVLQEMLNGGDQKDKTPLASEAGQGVP